MKQSDQIETIIDDIFKNECKEKKYLTNENFDLLPNAMVVTTKPFGTFHEAFVRSVLEKIIEYGYRINEYRVMECSDIVNKQIFKKQYKYLYEIAHNGEQRFNKMDYQKIVEIYGENIYKIIPAYDLVCKFGYSRNQVAALWKNGYKENDTDKLNKIHKIGLYKYVLRVQEDKINQGEPFLLLNGLALELEENYGGKNEQKVCVFFVTSNGSESSSWKVMREKCIGDKVFPKDCNPMSIRYQAYAGNICLNQKVDYWNNVIHMSSSLLETLHDEMVWLDRELENTFVGKMLLSQGFSKKEILHFTNDMVFEVEGKMCTLYHWIDKKNSKEAVEQLKKVEQKEDIPWEKNN